MTFGISPSINIDILEHSPIGMLAFFGITELFRAALCEGGFVESGVEIFALGCKHYAMGWQLEGTQKDLGVGETSVVKEPT